MSEHAVREAAEAWIRRWQSREPGFLEEMATRMAPDVQGFGSGRHERGDSLEDALRFLEQDFQDSPDGFDYQTEFTRARLLAPNVGIYEVEGTIHVTGSQISFFARMSLVFRREADGLWKLSNWHASVPWGDQGDDEGIPKDALKARAEALEKEVAERTAELEAATREAQVEAAMERIRSRALEMTASEELKDVARVMRQEMAAFGPELETMAIHLIDGHEIDSWGAVRMPGENGGEIVTGSVLMHSEDCEVLRECVAQYEGPESSYTLKMEQGEPRYREWLDYMLTRMPHMKPLLEAARMPPTVWWHMEDFDGGALVMVTYQPPTDDAVSLQRKAARAFGLAYKRFLDLTRAEAQARESQIEAALERVRSRATSMRTSEELLEVMMHIHREFSALGFPCGAFWNSRYLPEHYEKAVTGVSGTKVTAVMELPRDFSMIPELAAWERGSEPIGVFKFGADASVDYLNHMINKGRFLEIVPEALTEEMLRENNGWTFVQARTTHGELGYNLWGETDPSEEAKETLIRFASVFDLAFRRFVDLKDAEAQARASRIEAALERVRGQAMAMQKPGDISEVSIRMFDELEALGVESLRSGVSIAGEQERYEFHAATKDEDGDTTLVLGDESVNVHPAIRRAFDGWKNQEEYQVTILEGEDLVEYYRAVFDTMPLPDWKERMQSGAEARECFATFPFADGWLYTFLRHDITDEEIDLHTRFARVFGLAYQRYHDLTQAEADYQALLAEKARTEEALTELRATQKQLIEQEKLASLGSLTAGIAHEIKNPLNFVNNFAEVNEELADELAEAVASGDNEEANLLLNDLRENASQIAKHGKRADSIVRAMMQHARGGESTRESIDLNAFVEEYAALAWHGKRARDHGFQADVVRDLGEDAGSIAVMPQELGRVLVNLLGNAFDAVRDVEGGKVRISTRRSEGHVVIEVADNGPGIPTEIRDRIFEPFFTTKPTGEGTGLGLSLSYDIVTKGHGGTMTVGKAPEGGALFTIQIPA